MAEYEEGQIEFGILSLVRDPLLDLVPSLAESLNISQEITARLYKLRPDREDFDTAASNGEALLQQATLTASAKEHSLPSGAVDRAIIPERLRQHLAEATIGDLEVLRQELLTAQAGMRRSIEEELESRRSDNERAASRRHDFGSVLQAWMRMLACKSMVKPLLENANAN